MGRREKVDAGERLIAAFLSDYRDICERHQMMPIMDIPEPEDANAEFSYMRFAICLIGTDRKLLEQAILEMRFGEIFTAAGDDTRMIRLTKRDIAAIAHEANRMYCERIGDRSQPYWPDAPDWQRDSTIAGVASIIHGFVTSPEQSHESWMVHKRSEGWTYGETKDPERKTHPCMVPYADLPLEQKMKDALFFGIVTALAPAVR